MIEILPKFTVYIFFKFSGLVFSWYKFSCNNWHQIMIMQIIALYPASWGTHCVQQSMALTGISLYQGLVKLSMGVCQQIR